MEETSVTSVDLINYALEDNPTKMGDVFNNLVMQKVVDAVSTRKQELAQSMFDAAEEGDTEETTDQEETDEIADETNDQQNDEDNEEEQDENTQTNA